MPLSMAEVMEALKSQKCEVILIVCPIHGSVVILLGRCFVFRFRRDGFVFVFIGKVRNGRLVFRDWWRKSRMNFASDMDWVYLILVIYHEVCCFVPLIQSRRLRRHGVWISRLSKTFQGENMVVFSLHRRLGNWSLRNRIGLTWDLGSWLSVNQFPSGIPLERLISESSTSRTETTKKAPLTVRSSLSLVQCVNTKILLIQRPLMNLYVTSD
jgi:hypothetical protein